MVHSLLTTVCSLLTTVCSLLTMVCSLLALTKDPPLVQACLYLPKDPISYHRLPSPTVLQL